MPRPDARVSARWTIQLGGHRVWDIRRKV